VSRVVRQSGSDRARPRDRELYLCVKSLEVTELQRKVRFGGTPKVRAGLAITRETRALPEVNLLQRPSSLAGAALQNRARVFAIQFGDETGADFRRTHRFAFVSIRAIAKTFRVHPPHHFQNA
jgi:hypothetical protein